MKLLEGNVERNPLKLILPVTFGDITTKPQTTKAKINIKHKTLAKQKQQQKAPRTLEHSDTGFFDKFSQCI